MEVCHVRPDFNSGLTQFLIALVQTAFTPDDTYDWLDALDARPSPEELRSKMAPFSDAFELFDAEHPFMQSTEFSKPKAKKSTRLLISSPGDNTMKHNTDLFEKREVGDVCLCRACAATALFTLQSMANPGGSGLRVSVRGSSATTTIVLGNDLWTTVWLNVLDRKRLSVGEGSDPKASPFWWMSQALPNPDKSVKPVGSNPLTVYWAIPRRILLSEPERGRCHICGTEDGCVYEYLEQGEGNKYEEWRHPLSPYVSTDDADAYPLAMSGSIVRLDNWAAVAYSIGNSSAGQSAVVRRAASERNRLNGILGSRYSLWVTGYENNKAKPISWVDITVPVVIGGDQGAVDRMASDMVLLADTASRALVVCAIKGLDSKKNRPPRVDKGQVATRFWTACNAPFKERIAGFDGSDSTDLLSGWMRELASICLRIYEDIVSVASMDDYKAVALARNELRIKTSEKALTGKLRNE